MYDNRLLILLKKIIAMPQMHYWELGLKMNEPTNVLMQDLATLNELLAKNDFPTVSVDPEKYTVPKSLIAMEDELQKVFASPQIYLDEEERMYMLYLYTFIRKDFISNFHYQDLLKVSKNTTLADIKRLRCKLSEYRITLEYQRSRGYFLEGDEADKRRMAFHSISQLLRHASGNWALNYIAEDWQEKIDLEPVIRIIKAYANEHNMHYVEERIRDSLYLILYTRIRVARVQGHLAFTKKQQEVLLASPLWELAEKVYRHLFEDFEIQGEKEEISFIVMLFLGTIEGKWESSEDEALKKITMAIISEMERIAVVSFERKEELFRNLYLHLVPAYYRILFGIELDNVLTEMIQAKHKRLFVLVKRALKPLEEYAEGTMTDDEIAYFTIHFGGEIEVQINKKTAYRAAVICPSGISSSLILLSELRQMFSNINWIDGHSLESFYDLGSKEYDLVFSTVYVESAKPVFIVNPMMNAESKKHLIRAVLSVFPLDSYLGPDLNALIAIIKKYAKIENEGALRNELSMTLNPTDAYGRRYMPMLKDLLVADTIQFADQCADWEQAIRFAGNPLLENDTISSDYIAAMINKVKEFGPFIDLGKGVAIPHARPEEGVNRIGMSMLRLKEPVNLLGDEAHAVDTIICIAAIDNKTHLKALSELTGILSSEDKLSELKAATTSKEIINMFSEGEKVNG